MRWECGLRKKWAPRKQLKSALLVLLKIKTVPSTTTLPNVTDVWLFPFPFIVTSALSWTVRLLDVTDVRLLPFIATNALSWTARLLDVSLRGIGNWGLICINVINGVRRQIQHFSS